MHHTSERLIYLSCLSFSGKSVLCRANMLQHHRSRKLTRINRETGLLLPQRVFRQCLYEGANAHEDCRAAVLVIAAMISRLCHIAAFADCLDCGMFSVNCACVPRLRSDNREFLHGAVALSVRGLVVLMHAVSGAVKETW